MKKMIKYILIVIAVFLVGLMFFASIDKIENMMAVKANPYLFNKGSINYHYRNHQLLAYLHIVPGLVFLMIGAYQFIPYFRKRLWHIHRIIGRFFLATSFLVSTTAIIMAVFFPFSDVLETITTLVFGTYLLAGTYKAYRYAREKQIHQHQNWVLRVYFISLSIASIRIVAGIGMGLTGNSLREMLGISFVIAFMLHFLVVETWIRLRRTKIS